MPHSAENKNSKVYVDDHGIFTIEWKANVLLETEDFKTVVEQYDEWSNGKQWRVLHIFPKGTKATSEARNFAAKREKPAGAEAFVIASVLHRNLFRLYRRLRTVQYPMREFSEFEKAKNWLLELEIIAEEEN